MAGLKCCANFEDILTVVGSWKTVISLRATLYDIVRVCRVKIHGEGIAGDAKPVAVRLTRVVASSGTGTTGLAIKLNNAFPLTPETVVRYNFTVEPTETGTTPYLYVSKFHPQGGQADDITFDDLMIDSGTELALQIKVPAGGTAINVTGHIIIEE